MGITEYPESQLQFFLASAMHACATDEELRDCAALPGRDNNWTSALPKVQERLCNVRAVVAALATA